jgi:peptidyl-prolyl cis-trans isomerase B (cyclophilin B)
MKLDPHALPSTDDIQRTLFQTLQEKKSAIITVAIIVLLAAIAGVWYFVSSKGHTQDLRARVFDATRTQTVAQSVANLEELLRGDAAGTDAEPIALLKLAEVCYVASQEAIGYLAKGIEALDRLQLEHPDDFWTLQPSPDDPNVTLVRTLHRKMEADREWLLANTYRAPQVDRTVTALIETSLGNIRIGFFPELAPEHVANFEKLAKQGFYNGLLVHRVVPGFVIQTGDPNTRHRDDLKSYGQGGPGYTQQPERARFLVNHLRGIVSTAKGPKGESGSQFFICLGDAPDLDKEYTPFGEVVEGMDVVDKIGEVKTFGQSPAFRGNEALKDLNDIPVRDVVVRSVSIWKDGKIEDGHEWDTSIVGTEWKPEPDAPPGDTAPGAPPKDPELAARLDAILKTAAGLEAEGKIQEALDKVLEALELDPAYAAGLEKAAELRKKLGG